MMRSALGFVLAGGLAMAATADRAAAQAVPVQQGNPLYRPAISPYMNMARTGNPAINYYGLVKPQVDVNKQIQNLQMQQAMMPQMGVGPEDELMAAYSVTGHATMFFNYSHYFGQAATTGVRPGQPPVGILGKH